MISRRSSQATAILIFEEMLGGAENFLKGLY